MEVVLLPDLVHCESEKPSHNTRSLESGRMVGYSSPTWAPVGLGCPGRAKLPVNQASRTRRLRQSRRPCATGSVTFDGGANLSMFDGYRV